MSKKSCPVDFPIFGVKLTHKQAGILFGVLAVAGVSVASYNSARIKGLERLQNEVEGKMEGNTDQLGGLMKRICDVFAKMDLDKSDSIEMSELETLGYSNKEAKYLMSTLDSDKNGSISCNELVEHFLNIKRDYGLNKVTEHLHLFEEAVARYEKTKVAPAPSSKSNSSASAAVNTPKKDLPSTWLPILTARVNAVFKRIDMDGNNVIDKKEVIALQHGNKKEATAMFNDIDANHDGEISPHEFMEFFLRLLSKLAKTEDVKSASEGPKLNKALKKVNAVLANLEEKLNQRDCA